MNSGRGHFLIKVSHPSVLCVQGAIILSNRKEPRAYDFLIICHEVCFVKNNAFVRARLFLKSFSVISCFCGLNTLTITYILSIFYLSQSISLFFPFVFNSLTCITT